MNLRFSALFLLVLVFLLAACGGESEAPAVETEPQAPAEAVVEPTATLPPPVVVDGDGEQSGEPEQPAEEEVEAEAPPSWPIEPWPRDEFGYGVHSHAVVGDPDFAMEVVKNQLGMDWVKVQLRWSDVYPEPDVAQWFIYDGAIAEAHEKGLRLMLSVVSAPAWTRVAGGTNGPPDDFSLYADFLVELLNRYPGQIDAIEVWNEQNLDREWATAEGLVAASYVDFLAQANAVIEGIDSNIIVISGALAPTGVSDRVSAVDDFVYLDELLAAGMLDYADCVGAHHNGYNIPPDMPFDQTGTFPEADTAFFRGPFDDPHHSWSFRTTIDTYAEKVQAINPNMPLCVTEFGWATVEEYDTYPEGFGFALDNTLEEQATWITQAFQQMHDSGDVWLAFLFNFDYGNKGNGPTDDNVAYSLINTDGAPRPAFGAVVDMPKSD